MLGTALFGATAGVIGTFAVLRRRALVGDMLSHAALPGICIAFLDHGQPQFHRPLARRAGQRACWASASMTLDPPLDADQGGRRDRHRAQHVFRRGHRAAVGRSAAKPAATRPGSIRTCSAKRPASARHDIQLIAGVGAVVPARRRDCFTKNSSCCRSITDFATAQGWPTLALDLAMMGTLAVVTIVGLPICGVILMAALIILPGAAARFWTNRLGRLLCDCRRRRRGGRRRRHVSRLAAAASDGSASSWLRHQQAAAGAADRAVRRGDFSWSRCCSRRSAASWPARSPSCGCGCGSSASICCARCTSSASRTCRSGRESTKSQLVAHRALERAGWSNWWLAPARSRKA